MEFVLNIHLSKFATTPGRLKFNPPLPHSPPPPPLMAEEDVVRERDGDVCDKRGKRRL